MTSPPPDDPRSPAPRARPGGRTARVHAAVIAAAREVLLEQGAESFTLSEVARRAGVQRASLYRRYGTASRLLRELGAVVAGDEVPIPDTGSLRDDLIELLTTARTLLASPVGRALAVRSLSAKTPAEIGERRTFWRRRQALLATVIRRAVGRGEIASDLPIQLAIGLVVGPLWFRLFVTDQPVRAREIRQLAELMTAALTRAPAPRGCEPVFAARARRNTNP